MPRLDDPDRWATVDASVWQTQWPIFLGTDQPPPNEVRQILVSDVYQPDSFTIAERLTGPRWLDDHERDGDTWLRTLVRQRLPAHPRMPGSTHEAIVAHLVGETWRVLGKRHDDALVAEALWNQEAPYLVDRIIGWCLHGDPAAPNHTVAGDFNRHGRVFVARFLARYATRLAGLDTDALARLAVAAGLIGLDRKGGPTRCTPIPLPDPTAAADLEHVWRRLAPYTDLVPAVDHLDTLHDHLATGRTRLAWWLDDLIETAFDLLLIQRLTATNPRLQVTVVPKHGRHDNDACTADVVRLLRLPAYAALRATVNTGRVVLTHRGPRMATANPVKLHPDLLRAIHTCDLMVCKGGRVHEMLAGNVAAPMFTAYVAVRPFTEAQAGVDSTDAPLLIFGAEAGEWPWWGFHGRADRTLQLPSGRTIAACHTTVVEHDRRARTRDLLHLVDDLADLVTAWPTVAARYSRAAGAEIRLVHDRLVPHAAALPPTARPVLAQAHDIVTTGATSHAGRTV